jgi:HK97 family phage prohead protease
MDETVEREAMSGGEAEVESQTETALYRLSPPTLLVFRDEQEPLLEGRVVPYEEWSEVDSIAEGHFMERFARGSFTKTLAEQADRVRVYFEHGKSKIFDSQPIAEMRETWEQPDGVYFRAALLDGLPELFLNGLRRGLYGASVGAKVIKLDRFRNVERSDYNPQGLEERTYKEVRAFDFSVTPRPHYASASVAMRSINDNLLIERLLDDPKRFFDLLTRREETTAEPPHSEPKPDEVSAESRRTPPVHDYLRPEEDDRTWL